MEQMNGVETGNNTDCTNGEPDGLHRSERKIYLAGVGMCSPDEVELYDARFLEQSYSGGS